MNLDEIEIGPIRPPDEAESLLIRTTRGCPWNRCHYCTLFKGMKFTIRSVEDIKNDILQARDTYNGFPFETSFLQDGDSFAMRTNDLVEILKTLKETFPSLKRISSYGRAQTMGRKSASEIQEIHDAGLNMLYCGVESGSDKVLETIRKGVTADNITTSLLKAKQAGMKLVTFVIFGLGGREFSRQHIDESAKVLNQIDPFNIRVMSLAVKEETELAQMIKAGAFTMLSETEMVEEQKSLITKLENINSRYSNSHSVNLLNDVVGIFPQDKAKLLTKLDTFLSLSAERQLNFILGRRLGQYHHLAELDNSSKYDQIQEQLNTIERQYPNALEQIFHKLRNRCI